MPAFSDAVDLRNFRRAMRLGFQTVNRLFTNLHDVVLPLLLRKLDNDGKVIGREHMRVTGSYVYSAPDYVLVDQNSDYAFLPATITPGGAGSLTVAFVGAGLGTAAYEVELTPHAASPSAVGSIAIADGSKAPGQVGVFMSLSGAGANLPGFDIGIRWG